MLEVLEFIFSSFWVWLGTVLLIAFFNPVRIVINKEDKK